MLKNKIPDQIQLQVGIVTDESTAVWSRGSLNSFVLDKSNLVEEKVWRWPTYTKIPQHSTTFFPLSNIWLVEIMVNLAEIKTQPNFTTVCKNGVFAPSSRP